VYIQVTCKLKKKPPHGQAHLFFANAKKPKHKKIKELALPHRHPRQYNEYYHYNTMIFY